jgi:hypothetical protein
MLNCFIGSGLMCLDKAPGSPGETDCKANGYLRRRGLRDHDDDGFEMTTTIAWRRWHQLEDDDEETAASR